MSDKMTQSKLDELIATLTEKYGEGACSSCFERGIDAGFNAAIEEVLGIIQKHRDECDWAISGEAIMEEIKSLKEKV